jgi:hypothetical protein
LEYSYFKVGFTTYLTSNEKTSGLTEVGNGGVGNGGVGVGYSAVGVEYSGIRVS